MELRLLTTESERRVFAERVVEARAKRGVGFADNQRSVLTKAHLAFAPLYGLFEENGEPPERMLSGFAMHDLATFPQTCPRPDLSHHPAWSVIECGELWSFSKGAGMVARRGAAIIAGLLQARAILVYPVVKPWDGTVSYAAAHFAKASEPIEFPYGAALDGTPIWVQPMVIEGESLQQMTERAFEAGFETWERHTIIRFENPLPIHPSLDRPAISLPTHLGDPGARPPEVIEASSH
jgi:hypothetical protein